MFFFLIEILDIESLLNKSKNSVIKSHMQKVALSVEGYNSSYGNYPNEADFLESLKTSNNEFEPHCTILGYADNECLYSSKGVPMPTTCDLSYWRKDKNGDHQCYLRYYSGDILSFGGSTPSFRLYAMTFSSNDDLYVFDSKIGSVVRCPYKVNDFSDISECKEL